MWCLGWVCRPRCWFVSDKSTSVPNSSVWYCWINLWIQDIKKSLWRQILALKYIWQISSSPPRAASSVFHDFFLVFVVARITHVALRSSRAVWKINRDHRARLVSSNRDWFAYYTNISHIFISIRRGDYNASSGFGLQNPAGAISFW